MKAPDKIYLNCRPKDDDFDYALWSKAPFTDDSIHEEYIRKDALLEWPKDSTDSSGRLSYGEFIEKLNHYDTDNQIL